MYPAPKQDELDLKSEGKIVGCLHLFILYHPYILFEGELCQKVSLSLKTASGVSKKKKKKSKRIAMQTSRRGCSYSAARRPPTGRRRRK